MRISSAAQPWVSRIVRLGYLAKGVIYTSIGALAMRVAFGMRPDDRGCYAGAKMKRGNRNINSSAGAREWRTAWSSES